MKAKRNDVKSESFKIRITNKRITDILSSDLFWILLISGIIRLFYYSLLLNTQDTDSPSYLNYAPNVFLGQTDGSRTPVYPYFIKLIGLFNQQHVVNNVIIAHCIISFLSNIIFYNTVCKVFKTRGIILITSFLYGLMLPIINFDKLIRTESLSVFSIIVLLALIVSYLKKPSTTKAILLSLYIFFEIMLRPSFIILLPVVITVWVFRYFSIKQERKMCLSGLVACAMVILLILGYCNLNKRNIGFNGISTVTNVNQLDILIYADMYQNGNDAELTEAIKDNLKQPQTLGGHWNLLINITTEYKPNRIAKFVSTCIKNQPGVYISHIYHTATGLETENIFTNYATHKHGAVVSLVQGIEKFVFYFTFNLLYLFLGASAILIFVEYIKRRVISWLKVILWLIIVAQIAVAIIGAQAEYQRLTITIIPCLIILLFSYIDRIYYSIDRQKINEYSTSVL